MFSVASNSTVSDLSFDSSGKLLSFTVSGPDGTSGVVEVAISKELMADTAGLQVFLDGVEVPYDVVSVDGSWLVSFRYDHSTHSVQINLGTNTTSHSLGIFSAVILCVLLLFSYIVLWRRRLFLDSRAPLFIFFS